MPPTPPSLHTVRTHLSNTCRSGRAIRAVAAAGFAVAAIAGMAMAANGALQPENARADHMACEHPVLPMPRTVVIRPDVPGGPEVWRKAMAEWNAFDPERVSFVEVGQDEEADVYILGSWNAPLERLRNQTRVEMPCGRIESEVYVAPGETKMDYWAAHELGHTLGLADHIDHKVDIARYRNASYCDGYDGVMSYCSPRTSWWGVADRLMLWWHF